MPESFMDENFYLHNESSRRLYHNYASKMPIFDYHCHLSPKDIAEDKRFSTITEAWLYGDHYKWRAMRSNGISEKLCTGDAGDYEKFEAWANTVQYAMRNPLYHWSHLELRRYFNIYDILSPKTAKKIYEEANEKLNSEGYSARGLMKMMNVKAVCTTDDPLDDLAYHKSIAESGFEIKVLPTFRPDKAMAVDKPVIFSSWLKSLCEVTNKDISTYDDFIDAIRERHTHFHEVGCRLSDHGIETAYAAEYSEGDIKSIFEKARKNLSLTEEEIDKFKSAMMVEFGIMNAERNWAQQIHLGPIRNNNSKMYKKLGPDTGFDSVGDASFALSLSKYLDRLNSMDKLAKTILYNINPKDNAVLSTMLGNFQDGKTPGKMQFGSGWWFLDTVDGMRAQMNSLSNLGLLSRFVGMLTDSRSLLSYPRHEYFRRILCSLYGDDIERGYLPDDFEFIGKVVEDISFNNAKNYLGLEI